MGCGRVTGAEVIVKDQEGVRQSRPWGPIKQHPAHLHRPY